MPYRVYLRDAHQRVTDKTNTSSAEAARAAFRELTDRTELDGQRLLAVLNHDGKPIAYHDCSKGPQDPAK